MENREYGMKTTLKIEGMSCDHCVKHVAGALETLAGVTKVRVSLKNNNAEVEYSDAVSLETMKAAVVEAGYEIVS
jgi:copper ion binding protein